MSSQEAESASSRLSVYLSVYLSIYLSINLSFILSIYPSINSTIYQSINLSICLPVDRPVYIYLAICYSLFERCGPQTRNPKPDTRHPTPETRNQDLHNKCLERFVAREFLGSGFKVYGVCFRVYLFMVYDLVRVGLWCTVEDVCFRVYG